MRQCKYLVGELPTGQMTVLTAVVFSTAMDHREMAQKLFGHQLEGLHSAGMVAIEATANGQTNIGTFGQSTSLNMRPAENDHRLIARMLGMLPSDVANW